MTNHWNDIDNTSMVLVFGANPAENHPACMAHINAARFSTDFGTKNAKMIVVDPRLTRTALQCDPARGDRYVRIRPGTNVAFSNGLLRWILNNIGTYNSTAAANMLAWHNGTVAGSTNSVDGAAANPLRSTRTFVDDTGATVLRPLKDQWQGAYYSGAPGVFPLATGYPKYADTRFLINAAGTDYQYDVLNIPASTSATVSAGGALTKFPIIAADVTNPATVYQKLKAHVDPYTTATVADICGCTEADIIAVAQAIIDHSRFASSDFAAGLGSAGSTPKANGYRAMTILYAMGQTQHTNGSQNIKDLAIIQTMMGNMGRAGGGINALRGIHNVQGSTDFGLLYDSIPGYSANPAMTDDYAHTLNGLFGNRTLGTGAKDVNVLSNLGLQQRGFANMTQEWFGTGTVPANEIVKLYDLWPKGNGVQHIDTFRKMLLADNHQDATLLVNDRIRSSVIWGQNPAVTEPNQSAVRAGLKALDLMVCVDMFETETAACDRKSTGVTYLIPSCSHVEEAGSVTNSGRWLQWRERTSAPKGNSKADLELLLRFAYALDKAGAFSHITDVAYNAAADAAPTNASVWGKLTTPITGPAYKALYGDKYGWTPSSVPANAFELVHATTERWAPGATAPITTYDAYGSEIMAERVYKEICRPLNQTADGAASTTTGGTMWIYSGSPADASATAGSTRGVGGYNGASAEWNLDNIPAIGTAWQMKNRAKSRDNVTKGAAVNGANNYPRWGWAWLYNRRVFYNNGEVAGDQSDTFVSPGLVSCLFTMNVAAGALADWSLVYRKYKTFADVPSVTRSANTDYNVNSPHFLTPGTPANGMLAGRFPGHTEPYETPREDLAAKWGHNQGGVAGASRLVPADTSVGTFATYPLVLTSIRCVEHFQGGPITRNNSWNVEAEPVPWIEINSIDARNYNIVDGQWVNVITARSNSTTDQVAETPDSLDTTWARGFKARVGVGLQSNQRVAPGVVAIPWHWGDKGLSTGSRANDLCIDAYDANTQIPEYKACLCRIVGL